MSRPCDFGMCNQDRCPERDVCLEGDAIFNLNEEGENYGEEEGEEGAV